MSRGTKLAELANFIKSEACSSVCILTGAGVSVASGIPDFRSPGGMYDTLKPELLTATDQERAEMRANPTHVVSWQLFRDNQLPYLELRRPFMLGILDRPCSSSGGNLGVESTSRFPPDEEAGPPLEGGVFGGAGGNTPSRDDTGPGGGGHGRAALMSHGGQTWRATLAHFFARLLQDKGKLTRLYTQNIDGLDFQVGLEEDKIVNVHGSIGRVRCEFCAADYPNHEWCAALRENIKSRAFI